MSIHGPVILSAVNVTELADSIHRRLAGIYMGPNTVHDAVREAVKDCTEFGVLRGHVETDWDELRVVYRMPRFVLVNRMSRSIAVESALRRIRFDIENAVERAEPLSQPEQSTPAASPQLVAGDGVSKSGGRTDNGEPE